MNKIKILLVDDETGFRKLLGVVIKEWGYDLIEASDGKEAIDAVLNKNPDIIILDYLMPEMDGVTALKEIRKINRHIPVIMFTGYPDGRSITGAEELGISSYVPKLNVYSKAHSVLKEALHTVEKRLDKERTTDDI